MIKKKHPEEVLTPEEQEEVHKKGKRSKRRKTKNLIDKIDINNAEEYSYLDDLYE